jgi:hypothetical protein
MQQHGFCLPAPRCCRCNVSPHKIIGCYKGIRSISNNIKDIDLLSKTLMVFFASIPKLAFQDQKKR